MKTGIKISDEQFLSALRECAGLFSQTARKISQQYKCDYTRQAVYDRAKKFTKELQQIKEEMKDTAEGGLHSLMQSENEQVRLKAIDLFLKTQARDRGYVEKQEHGFTDKEGNEVNPLKMDDNQFNQIIKLLNASSTS